MQQPLIVPDTNVFVSGATIAEGREVSPPQQVIAGWRSGTLEIATSPSILNELDRVLHYDRVKAFTHMDNAEIQGYVNEFAGSAVVVSDTTHVQVSEDPDDDMFFACARQAQADYIVSGDPHVLNVGIFENIATITPRDFVDQVLKPLEKAA